MENDFIKEKNNPFVSVIVVNWNGKDVICECLQSLKDQTFKNLEIVVVDNGSTDDSVDMVKRSFPEALLVELPLNRGFGGGINAGLKVARGDFIALLNNDAVADPEWLENLVKSAESLSKTGMWASKVLQYSDHNIIDNTGLLIYKDGIARGRGRLERDRGQYDSDATCFIPSGCAAFFRKEVLSGGFDGRFFLYSDDVDVGLKGRFMGWDCQYVPQARVYHRYSYSISPYSETKAFFAERNRVWILLKYFPFEMVVISPFYTFLRFFYHLGGVLTKRGASGKLAQKVSFFRMLFIIGKAWFSALKGISWCLKERRNIYRNKRISRKEIKDLLKRFSLSAREIGLKE